MHQRQKCPTFGCKGKKKKSDKRKARGFTRKGGKKKDPGVPEVKRAVGRGRTSQRQTGGRRPKPPRKERKANTANKCLGGIRQKLDTSKKALGLPFAKMGAAKKNRHVRSRKPTKAKLSSWKTDKKINKRKGKGNTSCGEEEAKPTERAERTTGDRGKGAERRISLGGVSNGQKNRLFGNSINKATVPSKQGDVVTFQSAGKGEKRVGFLALGKRKVNVEEISTKTPRFQKIDKKSLGGGSSNTIRMDAGKSKKTICQLKKRKAAVFHKPRGQGEGNKRDGTNNYVGTKEGPGGGGGGGTTSARSRTKKTPN